MSDFANSGKADSPLAALAAQLVAAREAAALAADAYAEALTDPVLVKLAAAKRETADAAKGIEGELRRAMVAHVETTGEKDPGFGVYAHFVDEPDYNISQAFDWALNYQPSLLRLEVRAFELYAKSHALPFVTFKRRISPQIATDLGAKLRSASEPSRADARAMVDADRRQQGQRVADEIVAATRGKDGGTE